MGSRDPWWGIALKSCLRIAGQSHRGLIDRKETADHFYQIIVRAWEDTDRPQLSSADAASFIKRFRNDLLRSSAHVDMIDDGCECTAITLAFAAAGRQLPPHIARASHEMFSRAITDVVDAVETGALGRHDLVTSVEHALWCDRATAVSLLRIAGEDRGLRETLAGKAAEWGWHESTPILDRWISDEAPGQRHEIRIQRARVLLKSERDHSTLNLSDLVQACQTLLREDCFGPVAKLVIEASTAGRDDIVRLVLNEMHTIYPAAFEHVKVTYEPMPIERMRNGGMLCRIPEHWHGTRVIFHADAQPQSAWPGCAEYLSGAAWCANMVEEARALAIHEYFVPHESGRGRPHESHGPLLVLALTAPNTRLQDAYIDAFCEPGLQRGALASPVLSTWAALLRAKKFERLGHHDDTRECIADALLHARSPRTSTGWHHLPLFGAEILDRRMRPTPEILTAEAIKVGIPADLTNTGAVVWAMLCAARGALKHRAPEVAMWLVADALDATTDELTSEVLAVWEENEDLLNWEMLHPHPHLHVDEDYPDLGIPFQRLVQEFLVSLKEFSSDVAIVSTLKEFLTVTPI